MAPDEMTGLEFVMRRLEVRFLSLAPTPASFNDLRVFYLPISFQTMVLQDKTLRAAMTPPATNFSLRHYKAADHESDER
jgi:hypothetical protein